MEFDCMQVSSLSALDLQSKCTRIALETAVKHTVNAGKVARNCPLSPAHCLAQCFATQCVANAWPNASPMCGPRFARLCGRI